MMRNLLFMKSNIKSKERVVNIHPLEGGITNEHGYN